MKFGVALRIGPTYGLGPPMDWRGCSTVVPGVGSCLSRGIEPYGAKSASPCDSSGGLICPGGSLVQNVATEVWGQKYPRR